MSLTKLTKKELVRTAQEDFGVEVDKTRDKAGIIEQLVENGVTWDMYLEENPDERAKYEQPVPDNVIRHAVSEEEVLPDVYYPERKLPSLAEVEESLVLIRMVRANPLYEIRGYRFTKDNPFVLVKEEDADHILLEEDGFRQATPRELKEYYR